MVRRCLHEPIQIRLVLCNKLRVTSLETTDAIYCVFSEQNKCLCHSEFFFFCAISLEEYIIREERVIECGSIGRKQGNLAHCNKKVMGQPAQKFTM